MPYRAGNRLGMEKASKLGHLEVIKSDLVNKLIEQFEMPDQDDDRQEIQWLPIKFDDNPLRLIFAVDGSIQTIRSDTKPYRELSFIKTALLRLDQAAVKRLDKRDPHPMALRDILKDSALYHATVLPLKGIRIKDVNNYHAVRKIIFDSFQDASLNAEPYNTLKWLAYEGWTGNEVRSPGFECPHCFEAIDGLPYMADTDNCPHCKGEIFLTDMIGFHLEMDEDAAPESLATAYMLIHETLMLFTGIRYFWEKKKFNTLSRTLFFKDGPLTLRGQYSKLVIPIRKFFEYCKQKQIAIHVAGQEKSGALVDFLQIIGNNAPANSVFIPNNEYIRTQIQHRPERSEPYGKRVNWGNKVFVKLDQFQTMVLSVPTGEYTDSQGPESFIGLNKILTTLPGLVSYCYEGALVPIVLANGVASLSSYPSATILKMFADI
ncbi:MAG: hypothetical protein PWQ64_958 [Desulfomicrobiaceae bacterium]|nr:hypothetical protein [Desulfomicrobiaceae bacterium]